MNDPTIDVVAIQEAGNLPKENEGTHRPAPAPLLPLHYIGTNILDDQDMPSLQEIIWETNGQTYYVYYYDRRERQFTDGITKQNMAIVSKIRATEMFYMKPITSDGKDVTAGSPRYYINRPLIGIRIDCRFYFNMHPEPNDEYNEAPAVIVKVEDYMARNYAGAAWAVMGDYNREPSTLEAAIFQINQKMKKGGAPDLTFREIVPPNDATRGERLLDYAVVGARASTASKFTINAEIYNIQNNPSDHKPVRISTQ